MADWFIPGIGVFAGAIWGMIAGTLWPTRRSLKPIGQLLIAALGLGSAVWATWFSGWWFALAFLVAAPTTAGYFRLLTRRRANAEARAPLTSAEVDRRVEAILNLNGWLIRRPGLLLFGLVAAVALIFLPMAFPAVAGSDVPEDLRWLHTTGTVVAVTLALVMVVWFAVGPMVISAIQYWRTAALTDAEHDDALRRLEAKAAADLAALRARSKEEPDD